MKRVIKTLKLTIVVCLLSLTLVLPVSAMCAHAPVLGQWTGQYTSVQSSHTVVLGHYTNGTPITVNCVIVRRYKLYLMNCSICGQYTGTTTVLDSESHSVIH